VFHDRGTTVLTRNGGDKGHAPAYMPRRALRGGISKVNFEQSLSTFGNTCPQNGSKNEPRAPRTSLGCPHIRPFVGEGQPVVDEAWWGHASFWNCKCQFSHFFSVRYLFALPQSIRAPSRPKIDRHPECQPEESRQARVRQC
jgi:hypothetical protein